MKTCHTLRNLFLQPRTEPRKRWTELKPQPGSRKDKCEPVTIIDHHKRNSWNLTEPGFSQKTLYQFTPSLMAISNAAISIVSVAAAVLCSLMLRSDCKPTVHGLRLESYSEEQVKGCYNYNQTLSICFDVGKDFMKLATKTGEEIVFHMELGPNMFYYNVLGRGFIGWVQVSSCFIFRLFQFFPCGFRTIPCNIACGRFSSVAWHGWAKKFRLKT